MASPDAKFRRSNESPKPTTLLSRPILTDCIQLKRLVNPSIAPSVSFSPEGCQTPSPAPVQEDLTYKCGWGFLFVCFILFLFFVGFFFVIFYPAKLKKYIMAACWVLFFFLFISKFTNKKVHLIPLKGQAYS